MTMRAAPVLLLALAGCARPAPAPVSAEPPVPPPPEGGAAGPSPREARPQACISPLAAELADPCASVRVAAPGALDEGDLTSVLARAEAALEAGRFGECGELFDRLAAAERAPERLESAAHGAVLCRSAELDAVSEAEAGRGPRRGPGSLALEPRPLTALEQALERACARYLCATSGREGEDRTRVAYRRARLWYMAHRWDEAAVLFRDLLSRRPGDELAAYAANLYLDSLNVLGTLEADRREPCRALMGAEVDRLLELDELVADRELADQLRQLRCSLDLARAEDLALRRRHLEAAEAYLALGRLEPAECHALADRRAEVIRAAAVQLRAAGRDEAAEEVCASHAAELSGPPGHSPCAPAAAAGE